MNRVDPSEIAALLRAHGDVADAAADLIERQAARIKELELVVDDLVRELDLADQDLRENDL